MDVMGFEFSDLIAGYVTGFDRTKKVFTMKTCDGREFSVILGTNLSAHMERNLGEPRFDCTAQVENLLVTGQMVFAYGIFYPDRGTHLFEAKVLVFPGSIADGFRFEESDWWVKQAVSISNSFIKAHLGSFENREYQKWGTIDDTGALIQNTDMISRLVYGFASTYLLTGEDIYLDAAERGTQYLYNHMCLRDPDQNTMYWYHGLNFKDGKENKLFARDGECTYETISLHEQICALAGPVQMYRVNGDPGILKNVSMAINFFQKYFLDREKQGYFSHIDPITLSPYTERLDCNKARKNWNSVGDHLPAYLINLFLATDNPEYRSMLTYCADLIVQHFPDYTNSEFVQENFFEDWSCDAQWGGQQNCGVVGHNLKLAWNLMRINNLSPNRKYVEIAKKIAAVLPEVGLDKQRFGVYGTLERKRYGDETFHRFAWDDRKLSWQQEQGILAYQLLYGVFKNGEYCTKARELAAFYNTFFLDCDNGTVHSDVLNNGLPCSACMDGTRDNYAASWHHSIELCYLAQTYTNLLHVGQPLTLHFKPVINGFPDHILRVSPDILPERSIRINHVTIDGETWNKFDATHLLVDLQDLHHRPKIEVELVPER